METEKDETGISKKVYDLPAKNVVVNVVSTEYSGGGTIRTMVDINGVVLKRLSDIDNYFPVSWIDERGQISEIPMLSNEVTAKLEQLYNQKIDMTIIHTGKK